MKGFDWSEPLEIDDDLEDLVRIKMKDLMSDAYLYITVEVRISKEHFRELFLYVPYWIVIVTGLKLILLQEGQRNKAVRRNRNPHLLYPVAVDNQGLAEESEDLPQPPSTLRENERKRRHPRLLPSVPPVKGLLDLLSKAVEYDPHNPGQVKVLSACHSDFRMDRGCVQLRVNSQRDMAVLNARKISSGQPKWSNAFVSDLVGTTGEIEADDDVVDRRCSIGYSFSPAKGQYSRTKVIDHVDTWLRSY